MSFGFVSSSAEGASFNSRGRKAVDKKPRNETKGRRAGIFLHRETGSNAAPSALDYLCFDCPRAHARGYLMTVLRTSLGTVETAAK